MNQPNTIMQYFEYAHLPEKLQNASKPFCDLAAHLDATLPDGAEKATALRKLLEAKDAGVRAAMQKPAEPAKLWCVHVYGPDDLVATAGQFKALELANRINTAMAENNSNEDNGMVYALAEEWPYGADAHAADLMENKGEYQG